MWVKSIVNYSQFILIAVMILSIIVAADEQNGIGKNNELLCHLPADLKYFKQTTSGHCILMGRKTYESIGKPLPNRTNIVLSADPNLKIDGCKVVASIEAAITIAKQQNETELFITGGGSIYKQYLSEVNRVYLTRIHHTFDADTFFPELNDQWTLTQSTKHLPDEKNNYAYSFELYEKKL